MSESAIIPVTENQSVYSEYLSGEKANFSNALGLTAWQISEKVIPYYDPVEIALLKYRLGEKNIKWPSIYFGSMLTLASSSVSICQPALNVLAQVLVSKGKI